MANPNVFPRFLKAGVEAITVFPRFLVDGGVPVVPFVPTFIVPAQVVVAADIYNKQQPGVFAAPGILRSPSTANILARRPVTVVSTTPELTCVANADVYNKEGEVYNKEGAVYNKESGPIYNKEDPTIVNDPED